MNAQDVLREYQEQLDPHGTNVGVSRQALDETLDKLDALEAENADLREIIRRYATEVPLGHQPHMLAEEAHIACGLIPAPSGEQE